MRTTSKSAVKAFAAFGLATLTLSACSSGADDATEPPADELEAAIDAVDADAPGVGLETDSDGDYSAETDQPTIGADAVEGELGSTVAEPGQPITGDADLPANRATP